MGKPTSTWSHSFPVPVSRLLQVSLLASQPTESPPGGEPCGEPAISHDSHHVSLVQWTTCLIPPQGTQVQIPCETGILLLALSHYSTLYMTWRLSRTNLRRCTKGSSQPLLELSKSYYCNFLTANSLFLLGQRKKVLSGLARYVGRNEKTLQAAKILFYYVHCEITTVSMAKSPNCIWSKWSATAVMYNQRWADRYFGPLVRWSTAQQNNEMLADQRTGKNSGSAPADYRNWASTSPLLNYLREVI